MNVIQSNLEKLRLQLERLNVRLTPAQMTQLAIGLGVIFSLYLLLKLWQWGRTRFRRRTSQPRMRPRTPVATTSETTASSNASTPTIPEYIPPADPLTHPILTASPQETISRKSFPDAASQYWPVESKAVEKRNPFEESGMEYPWADDSDYTFGAVTPILAEMLPTTESGRRSLTRTLRGAGYYAPHALQNLSAIRYLGICLPILLFGALLLVVPEAWEPYLIAGVVIGPIVGWSIPTLYVRNRAGERIREIETALPDMLDLLNMCVSQGMTVSSSLQRVGKEIRPVYPALAQELSIIAEQSRIGHLTEAVNNFSERIDTPGVHSFTSLMVQTEQMGTSVSDALSDYSDSMRESQKQRADEKANAATFKLLFPTVLCLMPAVFLFLMGPSLIELNKFFSNGGLEGLDRGATQAIDRQR